MTFFKQYHWVIGLLALAGILTLMLGTPGTFFGQSASFLYSKLSDPNSNRTFVRTNMDFGDEDALNNFPKKIGEWKGNDYETEGLKAQLGADVLLMRAYRKPTVNQLIFFLIMQSNSQTSFHPPEICYPAQGWDIESEETDHLDVTNASWLEPELYPEFSKSKALIQIKKLVVTQEKGQEIIGRRAVIYFYVKNAPVGAASDEVVMIRVSAIIPSEGPYEEILEMEKQLMIESIPNMFELREKEDIIIVQLAHSGAWGILAIITSFSLPLGLSFYPQLGKLRHRISLRKEE